MSSTTLRACLRCHSKKIKCSGHPGCSSCDSAGVLCEPYIRIRKSETLESLKQARSRVNWLEDQIHSNWGIECGSLPTGTCLVATGAPLIGQATSEPEARLHERAQFEGTPCDSNQVNDAPELSLVALNATGDMRYLGPSSGAFFAAFATSIARSFSSGKNSGRFPFHRINNNKGSADEEAIVAEEQTKLSSTAIQLLLQSYEMWIQPLYPLLSSDKLRSIVERCSCQQVTANVEQDQNDKQHADMAIFYLTMALGAINQANTVEQIRQSGGLGNIHYSSLSELSPAVLYSKALYHFDHGSQHLQPRISSIQIILLISIYGSYGPVGSSQWQLTGLAMRMATEIGLHHSPLVSHASEQENDERNSVFWTAYSIEISLAYNLGRPPSIGEEHITAPLPAAVDGTLIARHYIEHRRIQSRIISRVYCSKHTAETASPGQQQNILAGLQAELDDWRAHIPVHQIQTASTYPHSYWDRLYHGTSFVLHRSSPLCPYPSPESLEKCIRFAGTYLDSVVRILRTSNVPLSWMLVQGVLFAGLTMLITARRDFRKLAQSTSLTFLLVDFPAWARTCSVCLAIMNERWKEELLTKIEAQFETLANDTLRVISSGLTSQPPASLDIEPGPPPNVFPSSTSIDNDPRVDQTPEQTIGSSIGWDRFDTFRDFLGMDEMYSLWDMFPVDTLLDEPQQMPTWQ